MDLPSRYRQFILESDVSPGAWIVERLSNMGRRDGVRVGEIIPTGFEVYARIFHPAYGAADGTPLRWRHIAEDRGRVAHPRCSSSISSARST